MSSDKWELEKESERDTKEDEKKPQQLKLNNLSQFQPSSL